MKTYPKASIWTQISIMVLAVLWLMGSSKVFAEVEIDLDEASKPTSTPVIKQTPLPVVKLTPTPSNASHKLPTETPTPLQGIGNTPTPEITLTPTSEKEDVEVDEAPANKSEIVYGKPKMKDLYETGIKYYQDKDYDQAIRCLTNAVKMEDKVTPKFYYAEAYATLGLIYQFHIIRYQTAYDYYKAALKYEHNNHTARKYIKQVAKHLN